MKYKVIEISPVDDETIEGELNRMLESGWEYERIEFVQQTGVRRPSMAFMFFVSNASAAPSIEADIKEPEGE